MKSPIIRDTVSSKTGELCSRGRRRGSMSQRQRVARHGSNRVFRDAALL